MSDVSASESSGSDAPIFVSDASAEAERLTEALRQRGYQVVDVPLGLLLGRLAAQRPALILCDVDAQGALDTIARLREVRGGESVEVIFIGEAGRTLDDQADALFHEASGVFVRPVEVPALLRKVEALVGSPQTRASGSPRNQLVRSPVLVASARKPYRHEGGPEVAISKISAPPEPRSRPPSAASPIPVERKGQEPLAFIPESEMSSQLVELLSEAEARLGELPPTVATRTRRLQPEAEVEAVLPADILAGLDEDIDFEDEAFPNPATTGHSPTPSAQLELSEPQSSAPQPNASEAVLEEVRKAVTTPPPQRSADVSAAESRRLPSESPASQGTAIEHASHPSNPAPWESVNPNPSAPDPRSTTPPRRQSVTAAGMPSKWPTDTPPPKGSEMPDTPRQLVRPAESSSPRRSSPTPALNDVVADDLIATLGKLIRTRYTGALALDAGSGLRRIVFREGDFVTVSSAAEAESLVAFLVQRGSLSAEVAAQLGHRLPHFGRHAGAALIGHGHLRQDELWSVLRAHAEWLLVELIGLGRGTMTLEATVAERLREEPSVFGGATGAEVLVEIVRRAIDPSVAAQRLGGSTALLCQGPAWHLLSESALDELLLRELRQLENSRLGEFIARAGVGGDLACTLYALLALGVVATEVERSLPKAERTLRKAPASEPAREDVFDAEVLRARILARMKLVEQGDYFAVLGIQRNATGYDIQKAYLDLRRQFEPDLMLTPQTLDLRLQVETILEVLGEAHEILNDPVRRERYRRALEAAPR